MTRALPDGWQWRTLGDVAEEKIDQGGPTGSEFAYVDISSIDNDAKRVTAPKILPAKEAPSRARQRLRAGDVVVSMTRPNLNAVAQIPDDLDGSIGSTGFHVLRAKSVEPVWLRYAVQTPDFVLAMSGLVQGALYPAVRPRDVRAFALPVPPADEQRRIVAEIEEQFTRLDAGVEALKRLQAHLRRYRSAVLKAATDGTLAATASGAAGGAKHAENETGADLLARVIEAQSAQRRAAGLRVIDGSAALQPYDLPKGWCWAALGQLAWDSGYGTSQKCDYAGSGEPVLRIPNIVKGTIDLGDLKVAKSSLGLPPGDELRRGDLLVVRTNGSKDLLGRGAVVTDEPARPTYFASYLIRFRLMPVGPLPEYLRLIWNGPWVRRWIEAHSSNSAGQNNVNLKALSALPIPIPPPDLQTRIVAEADALLSTADATAEAVSAMLVRSGRLRASILRSAFEGALVAQAGVP
jgi:type I restriction enzyme S subunit